MFRVEIVTEFPFRSGHWKKKTDLYFLQAEGMASELKGFFFNQIVVFNVFLL